MKIQISLPKLIQALEQIKDSHSVKPHEANCLLCMVRTKIFNEGPEGSSKLIGDIGVTLIESDEFMNPLTALAKLNKDASIELIKQLTKVNAEMFMVAYTLGALCGAQQQAEEEIKDQFTKYKTSASSYGTN